MKRRGFLGAIAALFVPVRALPAIDFVSVPPMVWDASVGPRQNLADIIFDIAPVDTPWVNFVDQGQYAEWETEE